MLTGVSPDRGSPAHHHRPFSLDSVAQRRANPTSLTVPYWLPYLGLACVEGRFRMPVCLTQLFVAAGFRLWPINVSKAVGLVAP